MAPLANDPIMLGTLIQLFIHLEHINSSSLGRYNFLVPFFVPMEVVASFASDPIMLGTSIWSLRHLKHQNLYTGDDFICSSGIFFSSIFGHQGGSDATCK